MKRSTIGWAAGAVVFLGGVVLAWAFYFSGGSGEPSTDLTTPTLPDAGAATSTTSSTGPPGTPEAPETTEVSVQGVRSFVIDGSQSTASFAIAEELRGSPNLVIGTTSQVAGQIRVDPSDLATAQFSQIVVNARTFETDSARRDRAIRGAVILSSGSDEFELITFDATSVDGLSGSVAPGGAVDFTITGDLTIKGVTNSVTFDVRVTLGDENTLRGTARATVLRTDYGIGIPSVASVANVADEVDLKLEFTATSQ